jgi:Tfp pilus assembly protein PilP
MMRHAKILIGVLILVWLSLPLATAQVPKQAAGQQVNKPDVQKEAPPLATYDPAGRRDPFKDLLGGQEVKERVASGGLSDVSIDEINLTGIVKMKGKLEAIISVTEGFPITVKEGDSLADGFILSITSTQVVFRKTKDRGVPLAKPKDVIKEISPEEL